MNLKKIFLLLLSFFIFKDNTVFALNEFDTKQNIIYQIGARGEAKVSQDFWLTNNFPNIYPKEFIVSLNTQVGAVSAWDDLGDILESQEIIGETTKIKLRFNKEVVGKGQTLNFHLKYTIPNFANRRGQAWEIVVPRPKDIGQMADYQATITVPLSFSSLAYASVEPNQNRLTGNQREIIFKKEKFTEGPIVLAFAEFQAFDFSLDYYLENQEKIPVLMEIPIPPETNYQEIIFSTIQPQPNEIKIDDDGNWIAQYILNPKQQLDIIVEGQAKIFSQPLDKKFYNREDKFPLFLQETNFWPINNPQIKKIAQQQKSPRNIYQFVTKTLNYDYQKANTSPQRIGADKALENPDQAVCSEFTDLFIALARAAGIPAREIEGYAYTNNPKIKPVGNNILHAWPEYWDQAKRVWVQIDPTWERTTGGVDYFSNLDLNHFALVIHGVQDDYPPPPGSYLAKDAQPNINIKFADNILTPQVIDPNFKVEHQLIFYEATPLFKRLGKIQFDIQNQTIGTFKNFQISLFFNNQKNQILYQDQVEIIPPFGKLKIFILTPPIIKTIFASAFEWSIEINDQKYFYQSSISNQEKLLLVLPYLLTSVILAIILLVLAIMIKKLKKTLFSDTF